MQSHRALLSRSLGTELTAQFEPDGVTLNWLPLDHVGGIVMCHISDVFVGCNEVLAEPEMILQQPLLWLDLIDRFRVTYTWAPNFAFALVNSQPHIHGKSWDLASLKFLLNGGEAIVPKVARRFLELLEPHGLPPTAMRPAWGMSETCSGVTYSHEFRLSNTSDDDHFTVVGRPIHGFSVRIANDSDEVLREGETGRLQVKGHCVTSGYYKDAERTDESFTADGWFVTGDLGVLRDGALSITGREKGVIIVNGLNYYSHEIESVVEEVPGVEVSFTAACPVRRSDGTTEEIAIFFARTESEDGAVLEVIRSISDSVRRRIGLSPGYVIPLMRDDIPKTEIGKIQRGELSDRFAKGRYDDLLKELDLELANERVIPNWFFRRVWKRKNLETVQVDVSDSPVVLIANNEQQVAGLLGGLASRNRHAATVLPGDSFEKTAEGEYRLDPHNRDHYRRLFEDLRASGANSLEILLLGPAGPRGPFDACERELSEVLLLSQALAASTFAGQHVRLQVCTAGAFSVSKEDAAPGRAVFNGLLKTLPQEYPWLTCRHVDLQDGDYDTALAELLCPQTDVAVAWRGGYRYVPQFERVAVGEAGGAPVALRRGGLYVLSGGAGGIGRLIAGWLIERFDAKVLVVGRRHEDAVRSLLAGIGRLDETLFYRRADVCEQFELNAAVSGIEQLLGQPVSGAFHLAGTFEEAPIEELTPESLRKALRAKTVGTVLLAGLLAERPGAALILFSSVNGFFGGVSAAAYSAANAFVDEYAAYLAGRGQDVRACAWSLWDETGMSVGYSLKRLSRSRGFFVLQPHSGLASLDYALGRGAPALWIGLDTASPVISQHCVEEGGPLTAPVAYLPVIGSDVPGHIDVEDRFGTAIHLPIQQAPAVARTVEQGAAATVTEPMSQAERLITDLWARLLPRPPVGIDENFFDCGGNSISIARVNAELRKCMDRAVPMTAMFQHPSIRSLARYITADADAGQSQSGGEDSAERGARRRTKLQRRRRPLSGNKKRQ
jgi:NADP-dependent 3-hydroxy acid dehydrogenase YdfG